MGPAPARRTPCPTTRLETFKGCGRIKEDYIKSLVRPRHREDMNIFNAVSFKKENVFLNISVKIVACALIQCGNRK